MQAGSTYTFETCGDTDFDTQLTIFNDASGAVVGYNDDFCGLQSSVTFVSDGSSVRVSLDRYNCQDESTCMTVVASVIGLATSPCNTIVSMSGCGDVANYSLSGSGSFDGNGPFGEPGAEQIYSFTATVTGSHLIDVTHSGGGWVDLFSRNAASGCSGTGWTFIDDVLGSASNSVNLVAGTTYYFMIDDENTTGSTGTITINCPNNIDPCDEIIALSGCDAVGNFALTGTGAFNNNGPWNTPGSEQIFSYTAPYSGDFEITVSHSGGSYIDLFSGTAASGCSGSGWTYEDDIFGSAIVTINLIGGTTYYFMLDDENTTASTGSITIACPCIPSTSPDGAFTYNGPFTISGSTDGDCNDCDLRPSNDQIYSIEIPCAGDYTFETCGGASFDTYLYLTDAFCGNVIALNDDNCGLQSSISTTLTPGTYFITIEAFSSLSEGDFDLFVSGTEDIIDLEITSSTDVSCFGGADGSATAEALNGTAPFNFIWSDSQTTATASGLSIGTYTVTGTDANGCVADTAIAVINQPTLLEVDLSGCAIVYDGAGIEYACATIESSVSGGTPAYSLSWSPTNETTGSIIVCPNMTTDYTLTATDANGCVTSETWTVTVVDLACNVGGSGSGSGSNSGSGSSTSAPSPTSYPSAPSCPSSASSGSSNSASGSGNSGSSSGSSSSSCILMSESSSSCSGVSGMSSGSSSVKPSSILMCFQGITYCVEPNKVNKKLACGFTLGPCNMQQTAACDNIPTADTNVVSCVCSDGIVSLNLQYIGASNQDLTFNAKDCGVAISTIQNAMTGDMITINSNDGGLQNLRNHTYVSLDGSGFGQIEIPTNCCNNPVGNVYFPFVVVGWTDASGNTCGDVGGGAPNGMMTTVDQDVFLVEDGARLGQFPNPADQVSNFEFSVPELDEVTLTIVNMRGEVISTIFGQTIEADYTYNVSFDVSELQSGIYFAHLRTSNGTLKKKFIVLK